MRRKKLALDSMLNLVGTLLPLAVGLITIPLIVNGFGVERFGLLTLVWAIIGYFSLFDMGIGRAMTQLIAERIGNRPDRDVSKIVWTGLLLMLLFSLLGSLVTAMLSPWFVASVLNVNEILQAEARWAFILLSLAIPAVVLNSGFTGILTAIHRFDLINVLRIPMGVLIFLVPLMILPHSKNTAHVCAGLMVVRIFFMVLNAVLCFWALPSIRTYIIIERSEIKRLLTFGGWMSATNVIGPLMVYMDRFLIAAVLSISAVTYYVTPYEVVSRLSSIPASIVTVFFPAFAASKGSGVEHAASIYSLSGRIILLILSPVVLLMVVFADEGMSIWLGNDFPQKSASVLQWLVLGIYVNGYAQVPFALIQGLGRPDITAKIHLLELPLYLILIYCMLNLFGIIGVAIAWSLRSAIDAALLTLMAQRLNKHIVIAVKQIFPILIIPLIMFAIGMMVDNVLSKVIYSFIGLISLIIFSYHMVITFEEKEFVQKSMTAFLSKIKI